MSDTIQRSNPQNVTEEQLHGMRLLSIEEAAILANRGWTRAPDGRSIIPDEQLFVWSILEEWSNCCDGSLAQYRTYATTRPEGFYLQLKKNYPSSDMNTESINKLQYELYELFRKQKELLEENYRLRCRIIDLESCLATKPLDEIAH